MGRIMSIGVFALFFSLTPLYAIDFDDLDLPPAGAHRGQMLLGFFITAGYAGGTVIDAEKNFINGSTYNFDNETTKVLETAHLPLSFGISYEYMPLDYLGLRTKLRRAFVVQRSSFGSDYENWRESLYTDYSFFFGVALHATNRKRWDFSFAPYLGYAFYTLKATPVAGKILAGYGGDMERSGAGFVFGADLTCNIYFSGGMFLSFGYELMRNSVDFSKPHDLTNPQTGARYDDVAGGTIITHSFTLMAGYAFSN